MTIEVASYVGAEVADVLPAVAALRIAVFREWPHLYDGTEAYERRYLAGYASGDAVVVVARDGDRVVFWIKEQV